MSNFYNTDRIAVTEEPSGFVNSTAYSLTLRVTSNRNVMLRLDGEADQEHSMPLPADAVEIITISPDAALSIVLREGEEDGYVWLTRL